MKYESWSLLIMCKDFSSTSQRSEELMLCQVVLFHFLENYWRDFNETYHRHFPIGIMLLYNEGPLSIWLINQGKMGKQIFKMSDMVAILEIQRTNENWRSCINTSSHLENVTTSLTHQISNIATNKVQAILKSLLLKKPQPIRNPIWPLW